MVVSVKFAGALRALAKTDTIEVPILENGRVSDVLEYVKECFPHLLLQDGDVLVSVNNALSDPHQALEPHDTVSFLPHIGGG